MACIYRQRQSCCSVRWAVLLTMTFTQTISLHKRFQKSQCPVGRQLVPWDYFRFARNPSRSMPSEEIASYKQTSLINPANLPAACFWIVSAFADNSPGHKCNDDFSPLTTPLEL